MADEDEIDILGEFSFNSCLAQNNQGIPSCSDREDTVHPQWLLDSTATNWYDIQGNRNRQQASKTKQGPFRKLLGNTATYRSNADLHTAWSREEKTLLLSEMAKYGRNVRKISQTLKTKTEAEIQALIEAEHGILLDTPCFGLEKSEDLDNVPSVVQEEIVTDDSNLCTLSEDKVSTPSKNCSNKKNKNSLLKPDALQPDLVAINPAEILYEDDLMIGSMESIGTDHSLDKRKQQKERIKQKIGNHRRKVSRNNDKGKRNRSKDLLKSPGTPGRRRKDSSLSEDSVKSPKLQIVLGSGQALPVSEGEQVIKIEKKKDSESESDIEVDVDSDNEGGPKKEVRAQREDTKTDEAPIAVPLPKFEPMRKRQKKINLTGDGGYTIMHTSAGDLCAVGAEPRRGRARRAAPVALIPCRVYNQDMPAPYTVTLHVSALLAMDLQAHASRAEVMGLLGGTRRGSALTLTAYRRAAAAAATQHCDMDPVSQAAAAGRLRAAGAAVLGWHHSHPAHAAAPSAQDARSQAALQAALGDHFLALVTSQRWPPGRTASVYRCFRTEPPDTPGGLPVGYSLSVRLSGDLTPGGLPAFVSELRELLRDCRGDPGAVRLHRDRCPQAQRTYLDKYISSMRHHMCSAGYEPDSPLTRELEQSLRDIFR